MQAVLRIYKRKNFSEEKDTRKISRVIYKNKSRLRNVLTTNLVKNALQGLALFKIFCAINVNEEMVSF